MLLPPPLLLTPTMVTGTTHRRYENREDVVCEVLMDEVKLGAELLAMALTTVQQQQGQEAASGQLQGSSRGSGQGAVEHEGAGAVQTGIADAMGPQGGTDDGAEAEEEEAERALVAAVAEEGSRADEQLRFFDSHLAPSIRAALDSLGAEIEAIPDS